MSRRYFGRQNSTEVELSRIALLGGEWSPSDGPLIECTFLQLSQNGKVKRAPHAISLLLNLQQLNMFDNALTEFPSWLSTLTNLTCLNMTQNQIEGFSDAVFALEGLAHLQLEENMISHLPNKISALTNLTYLNLDSNQLSIIPTGISCLTQLKEIRLYNNQIQDIPQSISELVDLTILLISKNIISSVPSTLSTLTNLKEVFVDDNQLSWIPQEIFHLTKMSTLAINSNQITEIPENISCLFMLDTIYLHENAITSIPSTISVLTNLSFLRIDGNKISSIPESISSLTKLAELDIFDNRVTLIPEEISLLTNMTFLRIDNNEISSIPEGISMLVDLDYLRVYNNKISELPCGISKLTNLSYIDVSENNISSIPDGISMLANLIGMDINSNKISELPDGLSHLVQLTFFDGQGNKLTRMPSFIKELVRLRKLDLSSNMISDIPIEVSKLSQLSILGLLNNKISQIPNEVCELSKLCEMFLSKNKISLLPKDLKNLQKLSVLCIDGNMIKEIPDEFFELENLERLDIGYNQISSLQCGVSRLAQITKLSICKNRFSELPKEIFELVELVELDLGNNSISLISSEISSLVNLEILKVSGNKLRNIPPEACACKNLAKVWVDNNKITNLGGWLTGLSNLTQLCVDGNQLSSLPNEVSQLVTLEYLDISSNPIDELNTGVSMLTNLSTLFLQDSFGRVAIKKAPRGISELPCWICKEEKGGISVSRVLHQLNLYDIHDKVLDLRRKKIESIPFHISEMIGLQRLFLDGNPQIDELPPWITQLTDLVELSMTVEGKNCVKRVPSGLQNMNCWKESWRHKLLLYDLAKDNIDAQQLIASFKECEIETHSEKLPFSTDVLETSPILGTGGFGVVFRVEIQKKKYALKVLKGLHAKNGELVEKDPQAKREISLWPSLNNTNIVRIIDLLYIPLRESDCQYCGLLMELCERPLKKEIERWDTLSNKESYRLGKKYMLGIVQGICYLHGENIVHRDLKTENILIMGDVAKISDFGLCKQLETTTEIKTEMKGTLNWYPPECFNKASNNQKAGDIFTMGTILWSMRTRQYPFVGLSMGFIATFLSNNRLPLPKSNPEYLQEIINQSWAPNTEGRPKAKDIYDAITSGRLRESFDRDFTEEECKAMWGVDESFERLYEEILESKVPSIQNKEESSRGTEVGIAKGTKRVKDMTNDELVGYLQKKPGLGSLVCCVKDFGFPGNEFVLFEANILAYDPFSLNESEIRVVMEYVEEAKKE